MIEISHFCKIYDGFRAVDNLNLKVERGDIFGFVGPNGAGKTTTIRFLATLLRASFGDATVDGHSVTNSPAEIKQIIGYMPDHFGVYQGMKVWEYLDFFASAYGIRNPAKLKVIDDVLELLDLGSIRADYVNDLSRGVKQRLCLAKTLLHNPPVLLLDEPASGLDPRARIYIKGILKELKNLGKTILISSHILADLEESCNKVAIVEKGKLITGGPIAKILKMIRSNRKVQVTLLEKTEEALAIIRETPGVTDPRADGQVIQFEIDGDDEKLQQLHTRMVGRSLKVLWFQEVPISLQEAFLRLTKGEIQ